MSSASTSSASAAQPASVTRARCAGDLQGDQRQRPRRRRCPLGQPQLRGPRLAGRAGELPRLAAAGRGLCARRLGASDLTKEPLGKGTDGEDVYLKNIWPTAKEIAEFIVENVTRELFTTKYADVFKGDAHWQQVAAPAARPTAGTTRRPTCRTRRTSSASPDAEAHRRHRRRAHPGPLRRQDHDRPHLAGRLDQGCFARRQVPDRQQRGAADFNQYGTRRGNHEVMMRGTFANIRIKNFMNKDAAGNVKEGGNTTHYPSARTCRSTTPR